MIDVATNSVLNDTNIKKQGFFFLVADQNNNTHLFRLWDQCVLSKAFALCEISNTLFEKGIIPTEFSLIDARISLEDTFMPIFVEGYLFEGDAKRFSISNHAEGEKEFKVSVDYETEVIFIHAYGKTVKYIRPGIWMMLVNVLKNNLKSLTFKMQGIYRRGNG